MKKNSLQCFSRYKRIRPGIIKGSWKKDEDIRILNLVSLYGKAWSKISKILGTRNGKQIRDRYINVLDPEIRKGKFTEEEDNTLICLFHEHGPKWAAIAKFYPNRTADMVKNRFHSSIKKKLGLSQSLPIELARQEQRASNRQLTSDRITVQIKSNAQANYFGSPCPLDKAIFKSGVDQPELKPKPHEEVEKIYSDLLLQEFNDHFDNDYGDKDVNMSTVFCNNPFDLIKMDDPFNKEDELEWNYDYFILN